MDEEENNGPIDFDFFNDGSEKESRPGNDVRHLSKDNLSEHDNLDTHSIDNTRLQRRVEDNGRLLNNGSALSSETDDEKSESDGERTARTVSSRSTMISVNVPSAKHDNVRDSVSETDVGSDCEHDIDNNNVSNGDKRTHLETSTTTSSTSTSSTKDFRPRTAIIRKHNDSWTSEDVSDKNDSDLSRSFSSSSDSETSSTCDSDASVTDVSPLHSPERTKEGCEDRPTDKLVSKADAGVRFVEVTPGYSMHGRLQSQHRDSEARELSMLLRAVLDMDEYPNTAELGSLQKKMNRPSSGRSRRGGKRPQSANLPHQRKNMSFTNDEVKKIDRENQRLLGKILSNKTQLPSTTQNSKASTDGQHMMSHAAIRRQREQRRIELENMKILQRIESAKASPTVRKDNLAKHHQKQVQYSSQVGKSPHRPSTARRTGSTYANKMAKASSMSSLNSDFSQSSSATGSRPSSGKRSILSDSRPPTQARPAWDEHWHAA